MSAQDSPVMPGATRIDEPHVTGSMRQGASTAGAAGGDNVVDLLRDLVGQGTHLAEQQMNLIKAELRETTTEVKVAAGAFAGAAVVGIAGLGVVLMGIAYLLGDAIENVGLATLIVGVATLILAYLLYRSGASKIADGITPDRSQKTLQRTPDAVRGNL